MSDEDLSTQTPPRVGSNADLARRMDRMEGRQDTMETEVRTLAATVSRVELNQAHATELAKLRFDAIESGMKQGFADLKAFQTYIEGILDGTIQTQQTRQGAEIMQDYKGWRESVESRFDHLDPTLVSRVQTLETAATKQSGVLATFSGTKAVILTVGATVTAVIALIDLLVRLHQP